MGCKSEIGRMEGDFWSLWLVLMLLACTSFERCGGNVVHKLYCHESVFKKKIFVDYKKEHVKQ